MKKTMTIFTFLFTVMSLVITAYSVFSCFHQKKQPQKNVAPKTYIKQK